MIFLIYSFRRINEFTVTKGKLVGEYRKVESLTVFGLQVYGTLS
jgi:hypothetical protein